MLELEFHKVELAVHEDGPHLRPSEVAENLDAAIARVRQGPGLSISALDARFGGDAEARARQFAAVCRLAKGLMVSVITIPASPLGTPVEEEAKRLRALVEQAGRDGLVLALETHSETLTSSPATAVALCQAVPGLALTLDPSHYINGPHQDGPFDEVLPYVQNVHFRDTGRKPGEFQVRVGQGLVEYGRIVNQLERFGYQRSLTVSILDRPDAPFDVELEVRKLKLLLESLL
jgi:sugar phosphate isomerase/epimerase